MGIYKDKESGNYGLRFQNCGQEYRKIIGPDKRSAEMAFSEIKNEIRLAKLANQKWEGFQKLAKAKAPRTFVEAAADYMAERANYKASTVRAYQAILSSKLMPEFGKQALNQISDSALKKFQVKLSEQCSASRVNTVMQLMRSILDQECRQGSIDRDPSRAVRRLQEPKSVIDPLSESELILVLSNVDEHYRPLFTVLAFTGARPNEMLALRWGDIDWKSEQISITKGRVRGFEGLPKTKSSQRLVPMAPPVVRALEDLQTRPKKKVESIERVARKDQYVFTKPNGEPIDKHLDRIWGRAVHKAELRHRPSYQLRHTFATQCIIKGFPLAFVAKVLGHSTIDTLVRHYSGWIDQATKENEDKLKKSFARSYPNLSAPKITDVI